MNTREFLKSIPLVGLCVFESDVKAKIIDVHFEISPPVKERQCCFEIEGRQYRCSITNNILIPLPDNTFEMNVFGNWYKVIAEVTIPATNVHEMRRLRFEGPLFELRDLNERWRKDVQNIIKQSQAISKSEFTIITDIPRHINLP